ncbi:hypothetical protein LR066_01750 [candidate division WOR-3 bacterium]|nr:hypothetical protein [candidate division WOR-3 bacterium]
MEVEAFLTNDNRLRGIKKEEKRCDNSKSEKSPAIAGLLSSVVPGAGKIYSGRSIDGIQSFITVGAAALQAYLGFRKDGIRSIRGWISSSVGVVFYLGNIYGSVIAARIHNEEKRDALLFQIDGAIISLCLSSRL